MYSEFDKEVQLILSKAKDEMIELNHPYMGTEHLFLSMLKNSKKFKIEMENYGISYDKFREEVIRIVGRGAKKVDTILYTPMLRGVLRNASIEYENKSIGVFDLFSIILREGEGIAVRILGEMEIDLEKIKDDYLERDEHKEDLLCLEIGEDLCEKAKSGKCDPVVGRDREIERVIEILGRKNKNNPVLIGDAGVGKSAIIEGIALKISKGEIPFLRNKRIISLNMFSIVSGTKYRGEFEEKMDKIIKEVEENKDIILFIDEVHTIANAGGAEGAIDAGNILKPALARGSIRVIGATTYYEYNKYIAVDKALDRRFQKVMIKEPSSSETIYILNKIKKIYEDYHNVIVSEEIIGEIVRLSDKYIHDRKRPDRCIDIMDEVCSRVGIKGYINDDESIYKKRDEIIKYKNSYIIDGMIDKAYECLKLEEDYNKKINEMKMSERRCNVIIDDVAEVISNKCGVRIYDILKEDIGNIIKIKNKLNNKVIGQEEAVDALLKLARNNNSGVRSIMFMGKSGVGKTMLAREFAYEYLGEDNYIVFDMNEFSDSSSINKLIGSSAGYVGYDDECLFSEINKRGECVILFDNIDKASRNVMNLIYQILDNCRIKDSKGNDIIFDNSIIIFTTNINSCDNVGFINNCDYNYFDKELISRVDDVVNFNSLDKEDIIKIIKSMNVDVDIEKLIEECEYEKYGAKKIDKIIKKYKIKKQEQCSC